MDDLRRIFKAKEIYEERKRRQAMLLAYYLRVMQCLAILFMLWVLIRFYISKLGQF